MKTGFAALLLCAICLGPGLSARAAADPAKPNIVLILADDLGWSDLACYGGDVVETPELDRLATQGVRFTRACAMPVCSPTRAALMTGKHAARVHITIWAEGALGGGPQNRKLLQGDSLPYLPHEETTLAELLHENGYLTALVGKWHLGDAGFFPETQGFDVNIGGTHWGAPATYWYPYSGAGRFGAEFRYVPHLEFGKPGEYLTDRLTDEALRVIDNAGDRPFFLYLAHHAVHTPIEAKPADVEHFAKKIGEKSNHQNPVYAAMIKSLDENVGRVLARLRERGLEKNTIVIFVSDNGGYIGMDRRAGQAIPVTCNAPLRSGKGSVYEGGVRVPLIVRWPGLTPAGAECAEPVVVMDLFHSLKGFGKKIDEVDKVDGVDGMDLKPLLEKPAARLDREALYFHYPHYYETTTPASAVRTRDFKLLEYYEDARTELYDLARDPSEQNDLAAKMPERVAELKGKLHAWLKQAGANMPKPNPNFKAAGAKAGKRKVKS